MEEVNPAKMAIPPSLGVSDECTVRKLGSSNKRLMCATLIIEGMANTAIKNAHKKQSM